MARDLRIPFSEAIHCQRVIAISEVRQSLWRENQQ